MRYIQPVMQPRSVHSARRSLALSRDVAVEFLALCDVAAMALRVVEDAGALTDDRPELALAALRRWCVGEATLDEVDEAAESATDAWSQAFETPAATAYGAVDWLCLGAQDDLDVIDDELSSRVLENARDTLVALGEAHDAAVSRVSNSFRWSLATHRAAR
jgi:hypothetical protein